MLYVSSPPLLPGGNGSFTACPLCFRSTTSSEGSAAARQRDQAGQTEGLCPLLPDEFLLLLFLLKQLKVDRNGECLALTWEVSRRKRWAVAARSAQLTGRLGCLFLLQRGRDAPPGQLKKKRGIVLVVWPAQRWGCSLLFSGGNGLRAGDAPQPWLRAGHKTRRRGLGRCSSGWAPAFPVPPPRCSEHRDVVTIFSAPNYCLENKQNLMIL